MKKVLSAIISGAMLISSIGVGAVFAVKESSAIATTESTATKGQSQSDAASPDVSPITAQVPDQEIPAAANPTETVAVESPVRESFWQRHKTKIFNICKITGNLLYLGAILGSLYSICYIDNQSSLLERLKNECSQSVTGNNSTFGDRIKYMVDLNECVRSKIPEGNWLALTLVKNQLETIQSINFYE